MFFILGNNVELVCNVHAHPTPIVKWFKNRMELTDETAQVMPCLPWQSVVFVNC